MGGDTLKPCILPGPDLMLKALPAELGVMGTILTLNYTDVIKNKSWGP